MTRSTRNGLATAAACGALTGLVLAYAPQLATPAPTADVPAAAARAATHGWPHAPTRLEARHVARHAHRTVVPGGATRSVTGCRNTRWHAARWACRHVVTFTRDALTGERFPRPRVYAWTTTVLVYEDGSATVTYPESD